MNEKTDFLEPDLAQDFNTWKAKPTPATTGMMIKRLNPTIDRAVAAHVGQGGPLLKSQARRLAIQALNSYDPAKAGLKTHLMNQLQGLRRVARQQNQVIRVPERVSLDQGRLVEAENMLKDQFGRDPTADELADYTGLSMRRIKHVRSFKPTMAEGTLEGYAEQQDEPGGGFMPAVASTGPDPWLEMVYYDLDPINKKIMEWTLGLHGQKPLSNQRIAQKLGVSPGAISLRKATIQNILDRKQDLGVF